MFMDTSLVSNETFASTIVLTDDFLYCPNCNKEISHPKLLECLHSFCLECLKICLESNNIVAGQYFHCPLCKTPCKFPEGGVTEMKDNSMVQSMQKFLNFRNNLLLDEYVNCGGCNKLGLKKCKLRKCMECDDWLCNSCCDVHNQVKASKAHRLYTHEELLSGKLDNVIKEHMAYILCIKHKLKYSTYCSDCQCLLCLMCETTTHSGHETMNIIEKSKQSFEGIQSYLPRVNRTTESLNTRISNLVRQQKNLINFRKRFLKDYASRIIAVIDVVTKQLNSYADFLHRTVEGLITDRLDKISKLNISQLKGDVEAAKVAVKVSEVLLKFNYPQSIMTLKGITCNQLLKFKKVPQVHLSDWKFFYLSKQDELLEETVEWLVGSLTYNAKLKHDTSIYSFSAKLETDMKPCVISDMALDNVQGKIVLIDEANKNLKVFDFEGCLIINSSGSLLKAPIRVVILRSGEYYLVNDENLLKLVHKKLDKYKIFSSYKFRQPVAVAQSTNGEILVAEWMSGEIIGFDETGVLVRRFPCYSRNPAYLSCCLGSDHVVLSDWGSHNIKIFHWNGNFIASYGQLGNGSNCLDHPHGISSDAENHIIICDSWNNRIEILDWKGHYLSTILDRKNGLLWPQAISILRDHCFVCERQGMIKVFEYNIKLS